MTLLDRRPTGIDAEPQESLAVGLVGAEQTGPGEGPASGRWSRLLGAVRSRRRSMLWFVPLFLLSGAVQLINMGGSPQRIDDEGTYTAQAWAIVHLHQLTHYTYWYDHPPLGWIQIAGWTGLTGAFDRYGTAIVAGREAMLVMHLASLVLLWMLARRVGLARPAAAATIAIYALSPLAVQFHRTVFLDNVANPWLLAAWVLVLAPRRQLVAFTGAAVCFAVAVLSKETYLLFGPFLAWSMWRVAHRGLRRYTVSVAAGIVVLLGLSYVLLATIKGELVPGAHRVSLMTGVFFQLGGRAASGSLFDAASQARVTAAQWLQLDPVFAAITPVVALIALADRRMRPIAAALVFLLLFMLRPGYLPIPYVIGLLPLAALCVPAVVQLIITRARQARRPGRRAAGTVAGVVAATLMIAAAAPAWGPQLRGLLLADLDQPMRQAEAWAAHNVPRNYRLVVDDSMWVDLVQDGFPRQNVVWYYKVDTDPAVQALAPNGWRDYDYVITTNSMRTFPDGFPIVKQALDNSVPVARFGDGDREVIVERVQRAGAEAAGQIARAEQAARSRVGTELATNPNLRMPTATKNLFTGGRIDPRALILLPPAATAGPLTVVDAPAVPGEESTDRPRRQVLITMADGALPTDDQAIRLSRRFLDQAQRYAASRVENTSQGLLITWDLDAPDGLLPASAQN